MKTTKMLAMAAIMGATAILPFAAAHAEGNVTQKQFNKVDKDRSGTLNESEFKNLKMDGTFTAKDTNGDSVLTLSELQMDSSTMTNGTSATAGTGNSTDSGMSATGDSGMNNSGSDNKGRQ